MFNFGNLPRDTSSYAPDGSVLPSGGTTVNSGGHSHSSGSFALGGDSWSIDSQGASAARDVANATSGLAGSFYDRTGENKYYDPTTASPYGSGDIGSGSGGSSGSVVEYPHAAIANLYGVDMETAYQEALANTAIQRRMQDYKAAGLNPVLAAQYNYGADSFSGSYSGTYPAVNGASGVGSSGSAGSGSGGSSGSSSGKGLFDLSKNTTRMGIASLVSAGVMAVSKNFGLGAAAYYFTQSALSNFSRRR